MAPGYLVSNYRLFGLPKRAHRKESNMTNLCFWMIVAAGAAGIVLVTGLYKTEEEEDEDEGLYW